MTNNYEFYIVTIPYCGEDHCTTRRFELSVHSLCSNACENKPCSVIHSTICTN